MHGDKLVMVKTKHCPVKLGKGVIPLTIKKEFKNPFGIR